MEKERTPGKFSLWAWTGNAAMAPQLLIEDLKPFAKRPEGVTTSVINGEARIMFSEDRFKAIGYETRNVIHWPIRILGNVE